MTPSAPWVVVITVAVAAQLLKFTLHGVANRRWRLRPLVTTNGLPSLYAVTFGCLSTLVLIDQGYRSTLFVATRSPATLSQPLIWTRSQSPRGRRRSTCLRRPDELSK